jgi:hypothetical protein
MRPIEYIAHKVGGDVKGNIKKILDINRQLSLENKIIPFIPYLADIQSLDDANEDERSLGFSHNKEFFKRKLFDQMGIYSKISQGIAEEIKWCEEFGIKVIYRT